MFILGVSCLSYSHRIGSIWERIVNSFFQFSFQFSPGIETDELLADVVGYLEACRDRYVPLFVVYVCLNLCVKVFFFLNGICQVI